MSAEQDLRDLRESQILKGSQIEASPNASPELAKTQSRSVSGAPAEKSEDLDLEMDPQKQVPAVTSATEGLGKEAKPRNAQLTHAERLDAMINGEISLNDTSGAEKFVDKLLS